MKDEVGLLILMPKLRVHWESEFWIKVLHFYACVCYPGPNFELGQLKTI